MKLNPLRLEDKGLVNEYLRLGRHRLSAYAFENIFIWNRFYDILWQIIDDNLCVFFKDAAGCFLYLPPLAGEISLDAADEAFAIMDGYNRNKDISRIENTEEKDAALLAVRGYKCSVKAHDYICVRDSLAGLKGDRFKSKRASRNYFIKNNKFECRDFFSADKNECLDLYGFWQRQRKTVSGDKLYQAMLEDGRVCIETLLDNYDDLDMIGKIVRNAGRLVAFSFGYALNTDIFCILYEITDISVKGLAQFIFWEFAAGLANYRYINIMDDSGLENLKKVKLSYHPEIIAPVYIAARDK